MTGMATVSVSAARDDLPEAVEFARTDQGKADVG
jgi:hypothetical protein